MDFYAPVFSHVDFLGTQFYLERQQNIPFNSKKIRSITAPRPKKKRKEQIYKNIKKRANDSERMKEKDIRRAHKINSRKEPGQHQDLEHENHL